MSNGATTAIDPSQSTLSPNFAPFVYGMLGKGWEAANMPFTPFTGQRFAFGEMDTSTGQYKAGYSPLEAEAFKGLGNLGAYTPAQFSAGFNYQPGQITPGFNYQPGQFNTGLGPVGSVQDYMNPFMQGVVDVQAREARRQADISRQAEQARLAQAGAFGGSRQAIMEAERQRNLGEQIGDIQSKGLMAAYEQAQKQRLGEATLGLEGQRLGEMSRQFGAEGGAKYGLQAQELAERARQFGAEGGAKYGMEAQRLGEASRQFGAQQGLKTLADQLAAGTRQREIAQQPLTFGYEQFKESVAAPRESASYMSSLLQGLPTRANIYSQGDPGQSVIGSLMQGGLGGLALYKLLSGES